MASVHDGTGVRQRHCLALYCVLAILAGGAADLRGEALYIYNWEAYISEDVLEQFTAETGIIARETYYDHESTRDGVIASGRGAAFDLILIDSVSLRILSEQGLFRPLSTPLVALGRESYDPRWLAACGAYGMPYSYGALGILYRQSVSAEPLYSWRQLFEPPAEHSGRVVMLEDEIDTPGAALLALEANPFTNDEGLLREAMALLRRQQPHLLDIAYGVSYASDHGADSRMSLTVGFSGDEVALTRLTGQPDWVFLRPQEGSMLWTDCFAMPAGRDLSPAASSFLEFISQPEVAARNAEAQGFASAHRLAMTNSSAAHRARYEISAHADMIYEHEALGGTSGRGLRLRDRMMKALLAEVKQ